MYLIDPVVCFLQTKKQILFHHFAAASNLSLLPIRFYLGSV